MNILQKNLVTLRKGLLKAGYGYEETANFLRGLLNYLKVMEKLKEVSHG